MVLASHRVASPPIPNPTKIQPTITREGCGTRVHYSPSVESSLPLVVTQTGLSASRPNRLLGISFLLALSACATDEELQDGQVSDVTAGAASLRIVEVLPKPGPVGVGAFVELRNDTRQPIDVSSLSLKAGATSFALQPMTLLGKAETSIPPGATALIVDDAQACATIEPVACEKPIQTTRGSLGSAHASRDDVLVATLGMQAARHCLPVMPASGLAAALSSARTYALLRGGRAIDEIRVSDADPSEGYAFERTEASKAAVSPLGATPGTRNYVTWEPAGGSLPELAAYHSSAWRNAENARAVAPNPLADNLTSVIANAKRYIGGALYQLNDEKVIEALLAARRRGVDVRIATDAEFQGHRDYAPGLKKLTSAGVRIAFDVGASGINRSSLAHNKFMVVDDEWVWSGPYNPLKSEPARIHADNAVLLRSPELAALHKDELELMVSGNFSIMKRSSGRVGADAFVSGALSTVRFSPGLTDSQLKARSAEFVRTGDPAKACLVATAAGKSMLEERYRAVAPRGGPTDVLYAETARATSSLYFAQFSLALDGLVDILKERARGGVEVKGVVDATISTRSETLAIARAGGAVKFTPNSDPSCPAYVKPRSQCPRNANKVWMHHKFVIIDYGTDHPVVVTGSHNMSDRAEQENDESLVVIRDRAIAESYYRIFREMYVHPQALDVRETNVDLPALTLSKVEPSIDPKGPQAIEITNLDDKAVRLSELTIWNRREAPLAIRTSGTLAPGATQRIEVGKDTAKPKAADRAYLAPGTSLVLATKESQWVSTLDAYTSSASTPSALGPVKGRVASWTVQGLDTSTLDRAVVALLGTNTSTTRDKPVWNPRGTYSDWGDGFRVTRAGTLLVLAGAATWKPSE